MQVEIIYESCWRNSFLTGENNAPLPKKGRDFVGSMTQLNKAEENYRTRQITHQTVMGLLNRLIGDQRKLYQAEQDPNYYFKEIEEKIQFEDKSADWEEVVYLRNLSGNTDQGSFSGMILGSDAAFNAAYSGKLWGVLEYSLEELYQFILGEDLGKEAADLSPLYVVAKFSEELKALKPILVDDQTQPVLNKLAELFPDLDYTNKAGKILPVSLYCSALYLQLDRLGATYDLSGLLSKQGNLSGISKRGFTLKDFMKKYTTGNGKLIHGNPYVQTTMKKGEGKISRKLIKARGVLTIHLDIDRSKARELKSMIEAAGVSAFPLGKKGLAYVSKIKR